MDKIKIKGLNASQMEAFINMIGSVAEEDDFNPNVFNCELSKVVLAEMHAKKFAGIVKIKDKNSLSMSVSEAMAFVKVFTVTYSKYDNYCQNLITVMVDMLYQQLLNVKHKTYLTHG